MAGQAREIESSVPAFSLKSILHWITAAAAVAVLLTALPLDALAALRPSQGSWLYWHIAGGWIIAAATAVRFARYAMAGDFPRAWRIPASLLMMLMLALLAAGIAAGLLAFRNPPMRAPLTVLGLFDAPVLFRGDHALHRYAIAWHRWLAYSLAGLIVLHAMVNIRSVMRRRWPLSGLARRSR